MAVETFSCYANEKEDIGEHEKSAILKVHRSAVSLLENSYILCRPFSEIESSSSSATGEKRYHLETQRQILETRKRLLENVRQVLEDGCRRILESPTCYEFAEMATECLWRSFRRLFAGFPREMTPDEFDEHRSECSRSLVAFRLCVRLVFGAPLAIACLKHDLE